jgi:hypothetical protein
MSIIPAHLMRSVGGGYDNESVAVTALLAVFYFWARSLRPDSAVKDGLPTRDSCLYGVLAGLAFVNMAAAWGGFVFPLNLVSRSCVLRWLPPTLDPEPWWARLRVSLIGGLRVPYPGGLEPPPLAHTRRLLRAR